MKLYQEKPGVISPGPIWILWDGPWLYTHESLWRLAWVVLTEWRHDRHLVG